MILSSKVFKIVSLIVLAFFTWTFGGPAGIANAAKAETQRARIDERYKNKDQGPEAEFEKTLEEINAILYDQNDNADSKKQKLKVKRSKIKDFDKEIRKRFSKTKKKLKEAGLSQTILDRHDAFVKNYEENFEELSHNLDEIDSADTEYEIEAAIEKANKHLDKVKPPKKHTPLDPNNLPFRNREANKKKPRMKKEEFERDFGKGKVSARLNETIQIASIGSLTAFLFNRYFHH